MIYTLWQFIDCILLIPSLAVPIHCESGYNLPCFYLLLQYANYKRSLTSYQYPQNPTLVFCNIQLNHNAILANLSDLYGITLLFSSPVVPIADPIQKVKMDVKEAVIDIFRWDGTLSSSDFCLAASAFSEKWKRFNPGVPPWLWVPCPKRHSVSSHEVEGYLQLENMCLVKSSEEEQGKANLTQKDESDPSEKEESFDYATLVCSEQLHEVIHYDFHVVYSASYRVPVLYFRAYHSDGRPLLFKDIEKDLPGSSAKLLSESKWTFITQEEHPYLNRPWYKLHPCGTGEWMKLLFLSDPPLTKNGFLIEQYLVSWFSVIGQVVGLKIPLGMLDSIVTTYSCTKEEKNGNTE